MVKPIAFVTYERDAMDMADVEAMADRLIYQLDGYIVLVTPGHQTSVKVLSPKKLRRADYQACINAAKKILSDVPR